ncbi:MAG: FAD-dependent oxidoreductase [Lachnospiraceae bacterium]|nr:FAD-dependent oxidoreductase [Lachnospiraceae bacterium]
MLQLSQCKIPYTAFSVEQTSKRQTFEKGDSTIVVNKKENSTEVVQKGSAPFELLKKKAARLLRIQPSDFLEFSIVKRSVDARKKPDIFYSYTLRFSVAEEEVLLAKNRKNRNLSRVEPLPSLTEKIHSSPVQEKIIVVGSGPAGLFCAYYLALCGCRPVLVERGAPMEERTKEVERFWQAGSVNPESNVSFGEGGAGTFSDGKLNTGVKDRTGRKQFVLESFVRFGAGEDILYDSKPHIGTDVLRQVIINMRKEMQEKGCEFHFHTKLTGLDIQDGQIRGIEVKRSGNTGCMSCDKLVLAIGHSARDTFAMLYRAGAAMSPKAFAIGMRVQHRQEDIDRAQYGILNSRLPASPYKCTGQTKEGRGVYSFCMCPGGYVVNASSEPGHLVVNGMSDAARDSGNANSAIVVTVEPEDFAGEQGEKLELVPGEDTPDCLAGAAFQKEWERRMYELAGGDIPVQRYGDFCRDTESRETGRVTPCVKGRWKLANLRKALPKFVVNGMIDGIEQFQKKIEGFAGEDTLLLGIETRTSSPVRMERDEELVSLSIEGLYPCGEGAGYAGGIMSAAMDGLRVAMKIQEKWQEEIPDGDRETDGN